MLLSILLILLAFLFDLMRYKMTGKTLVGVTPYCFIAVENPTCREMVFTKRSSKEVPIYYGRSLWDPASDIYQWGR